MNDPGLHEPIANGAKEVESKYDACDSYDTIDEDDDEVSFLLPARWWYASTVFPLLAGTFGPMANTFSVCALVQYWRVEIPPGGTEEHGIDIKDPKWLLAVNAVSLALAVTANVSLLLNMARRISFSTAQPITILGFWTASILLIAIIAAASHDFRAPDVENQALTQAYYYAIFAAGLYQFISYLLCITVWGAHQGHYSKEFKLTVSQRTLMLQTISFMAYLLVGAAIYSHIEGWKFLDAVYWADFTCLTVGIGDYAPSTQLGQGLLFPYAIGGIVSLGLVVGSIRSMVLDRGKKKLHARMTEKTRESILKRIAAKSNQSTRTEIHTLDHRTITTLSLNPSSCPSSEQQRRRAEFDAMRKVQELAASKRKWISLCISGGVFIFLWTVGALVFYTAEKNQNWTYFQGLYFAYTSLLTIGYGDFSPFSNSGKPFFVFWSLLAVPALTILISDMGDTVVKVIKDFTIYLGEITVLPSDEGGLLDSLKYGIYKLSGGKIGNKVSRKRNGGFETKAPGMVNMPRRSPASSRTQPDLEAAHKNARSLEMAEMRDEQEARGRGDQVMADEHHYRHLLVSEIKNMYSYIDAEPSKRFTYDEWAYFLRLLGEDEHDHRHHRRAPIKIKKREGGSKSHDPKSGSDDNEEGSEAKAEQGLPTNPIARGTNEIKGWSWLGSRSPLMGDKDEAEWVLERLLDVLERDLRQQRDCHGRKHAPHHQRHQSHDQDPKGDAHSAREESSSASPSS